MSNVEAAPEEVGCGRDRPEAGSAVELIEPREVPLGGPRAMTVRRTLPARGRTMVGAWCFADHYGPDPVAETGGMVVPPHPHTGLQTVSWLFAGQVEHRDSLGTVAMVEPGAINLMTAGRGISHSEVSTPQTSTLHGVQLWVALPEAERHTVPAFEHWVPTPVRAGDGEVAVFVGSLELEDADPQPAPSPVQMFSPIVGAEVALRPGGSITVRADTAYEHGVIADTGQVSVEGQQLARGAMGYLPPGRERITLRAGEDGARVVLLGGEPFGERILMWWNFVGRTHEEVVAYREQWQAEIGGAPAEQFGSFRYDGDPLPAPSLPQVRLRPRD